jgi:signal transduction histidine kinase
VERTAGLAAANKELDAFAYTISHDLRAPLRAMHGYSDALLEDYGDILPEDGRQFVHATAAAAIRMNALIEDILTYARLSREEITLKPQLLEPLVDRARSSALEANGTRGAITIDAPLGAVYAHSGMLAQMLLNLLSNALKFVEPGKDALVRISSERLGDRLRLYVDDNGIGIAPEHREQVFEPFNRLHGVEAFPGTGIGLAIVRRGAERMGGSSGTEPLPGGGSRFWIELRAAAGDLK